MVTCLTCINFGRKAAPPAMAKHGFGICVFHEREPGRYVSLVFQRECDKWSPGDKRRVDALQAWADKNLKP